MSLRQVRHAVWLLLPLALAVAPSRAADKPADPNVDARVLDFMADWQGDDGQWVDPMTFARIDPAKVKAEAARRHGKPPTPAATSKPAPAAGTAAR